MTDLLMSIQDEPNLHFTNFTKFYTMEDKNGGKKPTASLNGLKNDGSLRPLTPAQKAKLFGGGGSGNGGVNSNPSCGDTPPQ
jgi:hypothetical protein